MKSIEEKIERYRLKNKPDYISKRIFEKALNRLEYTISKGNKPNETDVNAFNDIIRWNNLIEAKTVNNNKLFAKLYIIRLVKELRYYKGDVFNMSIINEFLNVELNKPLDLFYLAFHQDLIHRQLTILLDKWKNEGMSQEQLLKEQKEFEEKYTQEYVNQKLNEMVNGALVNFSR